MSTAENSDDAAPRADETAAKLREATELLESVAARPRPARRALGRGAHAPAHGGGRRLQPRRRAAPPLHEGEAQGGARREHPRRRVDARRHRASASCARSPCSRRRTSTRRRTSSRTIATSDAPARRPRSSTATSASSPTASCTPSTTSSARRAPTFNFAKRSETADLEGRVAVLTGGRVKIGYQAGIKLLRAGAHLIVTTRFPRDSAARYAQEAGLRRLGRPARDLRPRPAPHAERRGVLPPPARRRTSGSTTSSTTPARPCAGRPTSTATCWRPSSRPSTRSRPRCSGCSAPTTGVRRYDMLERGARSRRGSARRARRRRARPSSRRCGSCPRRPPTRATCSPRAASTRICSRSTSATATRGGSCSPRCRPSSCSRRSSSTPSRRSCSTRG